MTVEIDHLEEDAPIPRQNWVCMSFMTPERIKNCDMRAVKVRGVYSTREEANERCIQLQKQDIFDVFVGEVGKWLAITTDPNMAEDVEYQEKELQKLAKGNKENREEAKRLEKERKMDMIKHGDSDNNVKGDYKKEQIKQNMRRKLEEKKEKNKELNNIKEKLKNLDTNELTKNQKKRLKKKEKKNKLKEHELEENNKKSQKESERLNQATSKINEKESDIKNTDRNIKKIKKLFEKYKQKKEQTNINNAQ